MKSLKDNAIREKFSVLLFQECIQANFIHTFYLNFKFSNEIVVCLNGLVKKNKIFLN